MQIIKPMLAVSGSLPDNHDNYAFEVKWDGIRAIIYVDTDVRIISRNLSDLTKYFPELSQIRQAVPANNVILDGEIIVLDHTGRSSFALIQQRLGSRSSCTKAETLPSTFIAFDILQINNKPMFILPYAERRSKLDSFNLNGPHWHCPAYHLGDGLKFLKASKNLGLEGIIAKKLSSAYLPGKRSPYWIKIKNIRRQEFVIGGWIPGRGQRTDGIGAILLGYYTSYQNKLLYAGKVGTGFNSDTMRELLHLLNPLKTSANPFSVPIPDKTANFVKPLLVCEVEFTEWTINNTLRHPSFKGLRFDKNPADVVRES